MVPIDQLSNKKAPGRDEISTELFKAARGKLLSANISKSTNME